jgi:TolA-binding protein
MYNKVRLTKRQIKEDKFATFMLTSKQQVQENWQFVVIGLIIVVLIIVGANYYLSSQAAIDEEAVTRYSTAASNYRQGNRLVAITSFTQILNDFPGNRVAQQATFMLAKANYDNRNYSEAIRYFEMYAENYRDDKLHYSGSLGGIANCFEMQADFARAAEQYLKAYDSDIEGPLAADYLASAMRSFLAVEDFEQAKVQLELIKKNFSANRDLVQKAELLFVEQSSRI